MKKDARSGLHSVLAKESLSKPEQITESLAESTGSQVIIPQVLNVSDCLVEVDQKVSSKRTVKFFTCTLCVSGGPIKMLQGSGLLLCKQEKNSKKYKLEKG